MTADIIDLKTATKTIYADRRVYPFLEDAATALSKLGIAHKDSGSSQFGDIHKFTGCRNLPERLPKGMTAR